MADAAADGNAGHSGLFCPEAHAYSDLARRALGVDAALAGDHHIRALQQLVHACRVQQQLYARLQAGAAEGQQGRAQTAGRPRAGDAAKVNAQFLPDPLRKGADIPVHGADLLRRKALLGAENGAGAPWAPEGVVHVAGHGDVQLRQSFRPDNVPDPADIAGIRLHCLAAFIQKTIAQGRRHTHAAVVGGAAPDAHQHPAAAGALQQLQQFSHAAGGGVERVQPALHQRQAGAARHLHNGGAVRQDAVGAADGTPVRPGDAGKALLAPQQSQVGLHHPLSPVGHGDLDDLRLRDKLLQHAFQDITDLRGGHCAFE